MFDNGAKRRIRREKRKTRLSVTKDENERMNAKKVKRRNQSGKGKRTDSHRKDLFVS